VWRHLYSRVSCKWTKNAGGDCTYLQILPAMLGNLIFSNLAGYSPKVCNMFKFLARRGCEDMPVILAGDFNVNVKDNYNAELAEFMKYSFKLDILSDLKERLDLILAVIWSLDEMWTIYPA
jgi:hypothetical protein